MKLRLQKNPPGNTINSARGFTLTEIAIVLGISGLVLGAIWSASANVYSSNNAQITHQNMLNVVQAYRSFYGPNLITGTDWTDITCLGVNAGFFPSSTTKSGTTCITGNGATYPNASPSSYSSYLQVWSHTFNQGIIIGAFGLSRGLCAQLASNIGTGSDVVWYNIDESASAYSATTPLTSTAGAAACNKSGDINYLYIMFKK
jgi:hypothetical protein